VLTITAPSSADFSTSFFYDPRGPCNADCTTCGPLGDCQVCSPLVGERDLTTSSVA